MYKILFVLCYAALISTHAPTFWDQALAGDIDVSLPTLNAQWIQLSNKLQAFAASAKSQQPSSDWTCNDEEKKVEKCVLFGEYHKGTMQYMLRLSQMILSQPVDNDEKLSDVVNSLYVLSAECSTHIMKYNAALRELARLNSEKDKKSGSSQTDAGKVADAVTYQDIVNAAKVYIDSIEQNQGALNKAIDSLSLAYPDAVLSVASDRRPDKKPSDFDYKMLLPNEFALYVAPIQENYAS